MNNPLGPGMFVRVSSNHREHGRTGIVTAVHGETVAVKMDGESFPLMWHYTHFVEICECDYSGYPCECGTAGEGC